MMRFASASFLVVFVWSCSNDSPTSPRHQPIQDGAAAAFDNGATTELSPGDPAPPFEVRPATSQLGSTGNVTPERATGYLDSAAHSLGPHRQTALDGEDFNCTNIEEVRVRFSDPGYVDGMSVGLLVKFIGMPAGNKKLRVWWDYENAFHRYDDLEIGDGDVNPTDESVFDFESVLEHTYTDVQGVATRRVRVEMILEGGTGNCARNRDIILSEDSLDHAISFAGVAGPGCTTADNLAGVVILANIVPPIPAGTTYKLRVRVDAPTPGPASITGALFVDASVTDFTRPLLQDTAPPNIFTANLTATVPHSQVAVAAVYLNLGPVTPLRVRLLGISIPGRRVGLGSKLVVTCP